VISGTSGYEIKMGYQKFRINSSVIERQGYSMGSR